MTPEYLIVHHSASNKDNFESVNKYHLRKWNFKSELGYGIGYHYFIERSGEVKQGRKEDEIGAHCKDDKMNYKSLGICLAGNFMEDLWTPEQLKSLEELLFKLEKKYDIDRVNNVLGHNEVKGTSTLCPGYLIYWLKAHRYSDPRYIKSYNQLNRIKDICKS